MFSITVKNQTAPVTSAHLYAGNNNPIGGPTVAGVWYVASNGAEVFISGTEVASITYAS